MKVLHTSDWHLGQQFYEHDRVQEHQYFLDWLVETLCIERIDLLLVAGDIYHTATPPSSAEQQLYQFIKQAKQACPELHIVIIAGNHDSANRIETAKPLLKQFDTHVIGRYDKAFPESCLINVETANGKAQVVAMPFLRPADVTLDTQNDKAYQQGVAQAYQSVVALCVDEAAPIIVMGHLHAKGGTISEDSERNISIGGFDAVTAEVFTDKADYVALGHLHKAQVVAKCDAKRYCGTPMPMSFSEKNYQHQVLVCEFNGKTYNLTVSKVIPEVTAGQFQVEMIFKGAAPEGLRRGLSLQTKLTLSDNSKSLLLAQGQFFQSTGGSWVFVVNNGEATKKNVKIGRKNYLYYEILEGLAKGDEVITSSYDQFNQYDQVEINK